MCVYVYMCVCVCVCVYVCVYIYVVILMPVFIKNFFASMLFLLYAKGQLKLQYLCKTTRLATKLKLSSFLGDKGIAVKKWPPQSPDMNPIENVWKIIGEKAQGRSPQNFDDLWGLLKEEWASITTTFCKKLIG